MITEEVRKKIWKVAFPLCAIAVAFGLALIPVYVWGHHLEFKAKEHESLYAAILLSIILAPIFEELWARGPVYILVKGRAPILLTFLVVVFWSGAAWGSIHLTNFDNGLPSFWLYYVLIFWIQGIIIGLLVFVTKSLWPSIVLHSAWNTYVIFLPPLF